MRIMNGSSDVCSSDLPEPERRRRPAARPAAAAGGSGAWGLPRGTGRKGCHAPAESLLTGESEPDRRRIEALPFKGRVGWGWVSVRTGSTTILLTGSPPPPGPPPDGEGDKPWVALEFVRHSHPPALQHRVSIPCAIVPLLFQRFISGEEIRSEEHTSEIHALMR